MNDFERVARAIQSLHCQEEVPAKLCDLARQSGLGSSHFHRMFAHLCGVTPKDLQQQLTFQRGRDRLLNGESVLDAACGAGLSGPGRLHDLCVSMEAASPGEIKSGGVGMEIRLGFGASPLGDCLIAECSRGVVAIEFACDEGHDALIARIRRRWGRARLIRDDESAQRAVGQIFRVPTANGAAPRLRAFVNGSAFQCRVWRALMEIPTGSTTTYSRLAAAISNSGAARAVGNAIGANPVALLIPCHRVIRECGALGGYRWGTERKAALLAWEFQGGTGTTHLNPVEFGPPAR